MKIENLKNLTKEELYELAREYQVKGRTEMTKEELFSALSSIILDEGKTQIEAEILDLGTPMVGGGSSDKVLPSSLDVSLANRTTGENIQTKKEEGLRSVFFDGDPLPEGYGDNKIVLMPKNPQWAYAYWEISQEVFDKTKQQYGEENIKASKPTIRMYDVTLKEFDGTNANNYFDVELPDGVREWFIGGLNPKATYIADIGLKTSNNEFITLSRSNSVGTPSNQISNVVDEEWMIVEEYFKKILDKSAAGRIVNGEWIGGMGASGAVLGSSEQMVALLLKKLFLEKGVRREKLIAHLENAMGSITAGSISAGSLSVGSLSAGSLSISQGEATKGNIEKDNGKNKDFWLKVGTELILYGATEPDAKLTVMGREVKLNSDGTFSCRYALPIGHYELPVVAVSADGDEVRRATPVVDRTKKKVDNEV
ncbi:DUF4912 domain-containing protein [Haliovirga abyssi]|uniref:DUF4912 domain-containing protein n=1 Tax=Haliovirga abyssi TaxID=2996794 RepID=A0AAU9DK68_9FUSO|nr:DUF4912 domain-containing protein [Haliovirga abyssi]BDU51299.1 hypothetical protein HLVA_18680 [Haliovirga abyssi]